MEKSERLREQIINVREFNTAKKTFEKEPKNRKKWIAPGIDGFQNF